MKKLRPLLAVLVGLLVILAVQLPHKTTVTTESISSVQADSNAYPEALYAAISTQLPDASSSLAFADSVYIIREEYLLKRDKTTYILPCIKAELDDVGIAGTSIWTFLLDILALDEDGSPIECASEKYNRSASTFTVEADPNTAIRERSFFDSDLDHLVSIVLEKNKWSSMEDHAFSIRASTLDSDQPRNVDSIVSFRWDSSLSLRFGKTIPFVVEAKASYINNYKG